MSYQHPIVYKSPDKIRHPYKLTENFIKWKFSPSENRILVHILERIKSNQSLNRSLQIDIDNNVCMRFHWRDLLPVGSNAKNKLEFSLQTLRDRSIKIASTTGMQIDGKFEASDKFIGIIEKPEWNRSRSHVDIRLDADWYYFLIDLSKGYTEYSSKISCKLSSSYTIKFYYFISHWFNKRGKSISLEQFRKEFDIPSNKYKTNAASAFRKKIIDPAKETLDNISDKSFNYTPIKVGKSIVGFSFKFYKTDNDANEINYDWKAINLFLDQMERDFTFKEKEKLRIIGIIKKYTLPVVKHIYKAKIAEIAIEYSNDKSVVNSLAKILKECYLDIDDDRMDRFYRR